MAINTIAISGRLTAAPELRHTGKGTAVACGNIAVDDGYGENKKTYFFEYAAWGRSGEYLHKYAAKGSPVTMQGKLTQQTWTGKDGKRQSKIVLHINEVVLPPRNRDNAIVGAGDLDSPYNDIYGEEIIFDESDLPF